MYMCRVSMLSMVTLCSLQVLLSYSCGNSPDKDAKLPVKVSMSVFIKWGCGFVTNNSDGRGLG